MTPRLTAALGAYNGERFIAEQLTSIAGQKRPPDRLIVCDDHSTDATLEIVERFAGSVPFDVEVIRGERNVGFIGNFERGLQRSGTEGIIVLSDQDDVWRADRLARIEAAFASAPAAGFVFSDAELVDERLRPLGRTLWESVGLTREVQAAVRAGRLFEVLITGSLVSGATMAFRAEHLPLLLPLGRAIGHDAWIALVLSAVTSVVALPEPLVKYRQHGSNQIGAARPRIAARLRVTREARRAGLGEWRDLNRQVLARLEEHPDRVSPARMERLRESVAHLTTRCGLPEPRARRVAPVLREVVSGRYSRLSGGIPAALRDLSS